MALGGHVRVDDYANIGGLVAIHQSVRIGTRSFLGGMSGLRMDFPPYMIGFGAPAKLYGPNLVGLRRSGLSAQSIRALRSAYQIIFRSGLLQRDALERVRAEVEPTPEVEILLQFLLESKRGVTKRVGSEDRAE